MNLLIPITLHTVNTVTPSRKNACTSTPLESPPNARYPATLATTPLINHNQTNRCLRVRGITLGSNDPRREFPVNPG